MQLDMQAFAKGDGGIFRAGTKQDFFTVGFQPCNFRDVVRVDGREGEIEKINFRLRRKSIFADTADLRVGGLLGKQGFDKFYVPLHVGKVEMEQELFFRALFRFF